MQQILIRFLITACAVLTGFGLYFSVAGHKYLMLIVFVPLALCVITRGVKDWSA